jgi:general secretion pathway protein G
VKRRSESQAGLTFLEMIATAAILLILASAVLPLARVARTRQKEIELHAALRTIRTAIDRYHIAVIQGMIGGTDVQLGAEGYPKDLESLVKGVNLVGKADRKLRFLRQIPADPMTGTKEWGQKCYQDQPDSTSWCGENVWDIHSKSVAKAVDGTYYKDW